MTSVNTDTSLGWALYEYMAVEILMNHCHGAQRILLRVLGSCSKGSEAPKSNLPQRAKCGVCPCCVRATRVPIPATYEVGTYGRRKANATRLWQLYGPMAPRTYAAAVYFRPGGIGLRQSTWLRFLLFWILKAGKMCRRISRNPCYAPLSIPHSRPMPMCPSPATSGYSPAPKPT